MIWGGEFGRSPVAQKGDGRDHHPYGFTMWLAGGGVKGGIVHGATDEFGWYAVEDKVHVHDLHATILHLMGIDHERADLPLRRPRLSPDGRARATWSTRSSRHNMGDRSSTSAFLAIALPLRSWTMPVPKKNRPWRPGDCRLEGGSRQGGHHAGEGGLAGRLRVETAARRQAARPVDEGPGARRRRMASARCS